MKRIFLSLLLILTLVVPAFAESTVTEELTPAEYEAKIAELEARITELEAQLQKEETVPVLEKGSTGNDVVELQKRLKELNYLEGSADGQFGKGTAGAVASFQTAAGLEATGIADEETQAALYAEDAPKAKVYVNLDYVSNSRDPDAYTGTMVKFSGKILQVMESDGIAVFRIATRKGYDDVVYCMYFIPENYKRFLEDDRVNVWATSTGVYTYETVMGSEITIPSCLIDRIELK